MTVSTDTNVLIDKVAALLPILEARGIVYLFAFAQRVDVDCWDVVVSSEWSDKDSAAAVRFIADYMRPRFEAEEMTSISRIAVIPTSDPNVRELLNRWGNVAPRDNLVDYSKRIYGDISSGEFLGSEVRFAFIFKARPIPGVASGRAFAIADAQS